ncbi:P protein isoform X2 [Tribolium castaneum]|uniref:P protein isoform X2 n=1 Tax=Tribolium castaneum TaxID=7070 RepID=UPI00077DBDB7|nr:PREDICTED: P protein isoform X2 [Tribolium castaneum]|eukprot:XP_015836581.1 PREDICTED: P protein isoform X2 [Tribolium castaneum]
MAATKPRIIPIPCTSHQHKESQTNIEDSLKVFLSTDMEFKVKKEKWRDLAKQLKIAVFVGIWIVCSCALMTKNVKVQHMHQLSISSGETKSFLIFEEPQNTHFRVTLEGALLPSCYENLSVNFLNVWVQLVVLKQPSRKLKPSNVLLVQNVSDLWEVALVPEKLIDVVPAVTHEKTFHLNSIKVGDFNNSLLEVRFSTNMKTNFPLSLGYNLEPINTDLGIIYAGLVLIGLYIAIIFELVHRTLAAMLASTMSVAILAVLNARPTLAEIVSWIDIETLLLLFSMMTLVTILSETGIFDYMSVLAYKITGGKIWPLINTLCLTTAIFSCFLDNVTTTLLTTPVTVKLCEVMKLNPVPVLMYMLIFANIGGAITPIGDPPNVIIASNADVIRSGINFGTFTLHMGVGSIIAFLVVYAQLRYSHRDLKLFKYAEPTEVQELRREIAVWKRAAASLSSYSKDEDTVKESLLRRSTTLLGKLKLTANITSSNIENYTTNLKDLQRQYPIRNKVLLIKSGITLSLVICVFFLHSIPAMSILGLGWTALLGTLLLLLLYDKEDIEGILGRVEWSTLLFFASLFILMEALSRLGLIDWVGKQTQTVIMSVDQDSRLTVAIVLILWVSGIASAFVDNLPLTTMMIRIATNLANDQELQLPLQPLIWALSFGACLGVCLVRLRILCVPEWPNNMATDLRFCNLQRLASLSQSQAWRLSLFI